MVMLLYPHLNPFHQLKNKRLLLWVTPPWMAMRLSEVILQCSKAPSLQTPPGRSRKTDEKQNLERPFFLSGAGMRTRLAATAEYLRFKLFTSDPESPRHGVTCSFRSCELKFQVVENWIMGSSSVASCQQAQSTGHSAMRC